MSETATMVTELMEAVGLSAEQLPTSGYPVVYGTVAAGRKRTLSFYNHYDVQPEDPLEQWDVDPFGAEVIDGKLIARGAADNKGNLVARLAAVHAYRQLFGELPVDITFIVEGEEEIGSPHLPEFASRHPAKLRADGCIWEFGYRGPDGRQQVSLGVKGICYVELRSKGANTDLHSSQAAIVENPAWRLVWALATLKDASDRVTMSGFYDRVAPLDDADKRALDAMAFDEAAMREQLDLSRFIGAKSGAALKKKLVFEPTCTICGLHAGYGGTGTKTVLPNRAVAKIDFRLVPDQDPAEVLELLRRHLSEHGFGDIEVVDLNGERPARTRLDDPLVATVSRSVQEVYGSEPNLIPMSAGSGPMHVLCQARNIPAVSIGVGHSDSRTHAPNENIYLADFVRGIKLIATVMHRFGQG